MIDRFDARLQFPAWPALCAPKRSLMFVTFEGIEGSGKSTLMAAVAGALATAGTPHVVTREPGGTPLGERLRALFIDPASRIDPLAEVYVLNASRAQLVAEVIRPALARGEIVLCDRFFDATVAYQGYGRGLEPKTLLQISLLATGGLEPDATLLLDIPAELSAQRVAERHQRSGGALDRLELERMEFHRRVRAGYLALARRFPRIIVLDATQPVAVLCEAAMAAIGARAS